MEPSFLEPTDHLSGLPHELLLSILSYSTISSLPSVLFTSKLLYYELKSSLSLWKELSLRWWNDHALGSECSLEEIAGVLWTFANKDWMWVGMCLSASADKKTGLSWKFHYTFTQEGRVRTHTSIGER